jgi:integrase
VRKIHIVLHRALEVAVRWRYLPRNPPDDVDPPTASKRDVRPPEPAELTRLVDAAEAAQDRLAALRALAIYTGCRQGELLALGWTDVDMERAILSVRRNLIQAKNQTPLFGAPNSETSRRTISLPVAAVAALRAHKARHSRLWCGAPNGGLAMRSRCDRGQEATPQPDAARGPRRITNVHLRSG